MALSFWVCVNLCFVLTRTKMSKDTVTAVRQDGLRYQSKVGGSPFLGSGHTRSCFKCGKHRAPASLQSIRLLGRNEVVCKPNCKAEP